MDFHRLEGARRASGRRWKSKSTPTALATEALMINNTNYAHWDRLKAKILGRSVQQRNEDGPQLFSL